MHELCADGAAINPPGLFRTLAVTGKVGIAAANRASKGIQVGIQVSPAAIGVKNLLAKLFVPKGDFGSR
jgi:hypothetical protein